MHAILSPKILTKIFFAAFAVLFIMAEQGSPFVPVHVEEWTADYLISVREGTMQREAAYVLFAMTTLVLAVSLRRAPNHRIHRAAIVMCGLFAVWAGASALWSEQPGAVLRRLVVLGITLCWAYVCASRWSGATLVKFVTFSTLTTVIVSFSTEVLNGRLTLLDPDYRLSGTLAPNELGLTAMVLVLAAITVAYTSRERRLFFLSCAVAGLTALALTKSRTALVGLSVGGLVFFKLTVQTKAKLQMLWMLACGLLLAVICIGPDLVESAATLIPRSQEEVGTLNGRMPMWQDVFEHYAVTRPMTGFGYTTFWTPDHITKISDDAGWGVSAAHSAYLEVLLDLGVPGLVLYLALTVTSLYIVRRRMAVSKAPHLVFCASLICGLLIIGVTESELPFRSSAIYFYSVVALLLPFATERSERHFAVRVQNSCRPSLRRCVDSVKDPKQIDHAIANRSAFNKLIGPQNSATPPTL
jgi:O-antigen ligase